MYKRGLKKVIKTFINYYKAAVTTITALKADILPAQSKIIIIKRIVIFMRSICLLTKFRQIPVPVPVKFQFRSIYGVSAREQGVRVIAWEQGTRVSAWKQDVSVSAFEQGVRVNAWEKGVKGDCMGTRCEGECMGTRCEGECMGTRCEGESHVKKV